MASEVLKNTCQLQRGQRDALLERMHSIKEHLLQCAAAAASYHRALATEVEAFEASGYRPATGARTLEHFPVVPDLEATVTAFLVSARRAITEICQVPGHFWPIAQQHTVLAHLLTKELEPRLGTDHGLVACLRDFVDPVSRIVALRNGQEHPATTKGPRLHVRNFQMAPSGQVQAPVWFLDCEEPEDIDAHCGAIADFLLRFAEAMFVGCVHGTLPDWPPMRFELVDPVDLECPTRYRLAVDVSRIRFEPPRDGQD